MAGGLREGYSVMISHDIGNAPLRLAKNSSPPRDFLQLPPRMYLAGLLRFL